MHAKVERLERLEPALTRLIAALVGASSRNELPEVIDRELDAFFEAVTTE